MIRLSLAISLLASPLVAADSKEDRCQYQADVVTAIQQARLDRVRERKVPEAIAATNPTWPDNYNAMIPLITPWIYDQKMRVIRKESLADVMLEQCLKT